MFYLNFTLIPRVPQPTTIYHLDFYPFRKKIQAHGTSNIITNKY